MVRVGVVNGPAALGDIKSEEIVRRIEEYLVKLASEEVDIIVLPEYLDVLGRKKDEMLKYAHKEGDDFIERYINFSKKYGILIFVPLLYREREKVFNTTLLIYNGVIIGRYDKVHLSYFERYVLKLIPGNDIKVFDTVWGKVGVMTCFDAYFPEFSRILGLKGARLIAFPSTQRSETEDFLYIQARVRAFDSSAYIARASYGVPIGHAWKPGIPVGQSFIVSPDTTILANTGRTEGYTYTEIDMDKKFLREASHGMPSIPLRNLFRYRRPELYSYLCKES